MSKIITTEIFIEKAILKHGNKYDYSLVDYINAKSKVIITCPTHDKFEQRPNDHLQGKGCPKCSGNELLTTKHFINDAKKIHGNLYSYLLVDYINCMTKIKIICKKHGHGIFEQTPSKHLRGQGCPKCIGRHNTTENFINEANMIHNKKYDYSLVNYKKSEEKIIIKCPISGHGEFEQTPYSHLRGSGCPKCGGIYSPTTEEFIRNAKIVHGDKYDYSLVDYKGAFNKIKIICRCREHGEFEQTPSDHLQGQGCPKCSSSISLPEIIWLNINHIKPEFRQYKILNYTVDGYDPNTNTVYEFHGDYWHGNPNIYKSSDINKVAHKTFEKLYENTIKREQAFTDAGYNLITIWESEFREQYKEQIKNYKSLHGAQKIIESNNY